MRMNVFALIAILMTGIMMSACADNHCTPAQAKEGFCGAAQSHCSMDDRKNGKCWPK